MSSRADNPYSRLNYRRLIAWPQRIEREWPFIQSQLKLAPEPSLLDLGCGTGEHTRHVASRGYRAVGLDRSEEQIAKATDYEGEYGAAGPTFVLADMLDMSEHLAEQFGVGLCLGNVVPHLEDEALERVLGECRDVLLPRGRLVLQLLNYERIIGDGIRHLPLNFREEPSGNGEIVFVRLLAPDRDGDDRHILFFPSTLALRPGTDRPVEIEATKEVRLRAWRRPELDEPFRKAGFAIDAVFGDMTGGPYDRENSSDLVVVAIKVSG